MTTQPQRQQPSRSTSRSRSKTSFVRVAAAALFLLLGYAQAQDCDVETVLGQIVEPSTAFEDGTLHLVANRPNDYILEPNRRDLLRRGGTYPLDLLVPESDTNEAFRGALLRIEGQGMLVAGPNAQVIECNDDDEHAVMTIDEELKTEFGGIFTVALNSTNPDIKVAISALFWSIEDGSRLAESNFVFGLAAPRTSAPTTAAVTAAPTTSPTQSPAAAAVVESNSSSGSADSEDTNSTEVTSPMTTTSTTAAPTLAPVAVAAPVGPILLDPPTSSTSAPAVDSDREMDNSSSVVGAAPTSPPVPTALPTAFPTDVGDRYFLDSGEPACQFCSDGNNMTLGITTTTPLLVIIDRLPFYCRDFAERPELFPEAFCATHQSTITEQCGGCISDIEEEPTPPTPANSTATNHAESTDSERDTTPPLVDPLVNTTKDPVFPGAPTVSPAESSAIVAAASLDTAAPAAAPTDAITYILSGTITLYYADDESTTPACNLCGGPQYTLGDTTGTVKVNKLPFNCRDLAEVPELFYPEFCDANADLIVRVCGGCTLLVDDNDATAVTSSTTATTAMMALAVLLVGLVVV